MNVISLAGRWQYALDPQCVGDDERWFAREFGEGINLPATLDEAGIGTPNFAMSPPES